MIEANTRKLFLHLSALTAALAVAASGCGREDRAHGIAPHVEAPGVPLPPPAIDEPPPVVGDEPPPGGCDGAVWLRVRGVDRGDVTALRLDVSSVTVSADGAPLDVAAPFVGRLDLLSDGALTVGVVRPPAGARVLDVLLAIAGGSGVKAGAEVLFGSCPSPLEFRVDLAQVDPLRCHAVVHLDLARSVTDELQLGGFVWTLLPSFSVHH